ncbi:ammonium transporter [Teladorsagia circumcincta]|uniref:Ammonium transporter n=1 Tax=Teladorsagia circumcincta TaxID=45464 RepID=A0A2G9V4T3_TELCI|nr:ammonium transporter [Teladorsagia circumcincta]
MASAFQKNQFTILVVIAQRYGYSAVSVNLFLSCITIEWSIIVRGLLSHDFARDGKFGIGVEQLLTADFAAAVILISMGAMLGKLSPTQYLIMALIETPVAIFVEHHVVHTFHKKFDMVHIANSTLAGGVAIGTTANVVLHPLHALIVGVIAGLISVIGFRYITPLLSKKLGAHDTCGVNNLHGMPGVLAGLLSAVFVLAYDPADYGKSLNIIYPAMWSETNDTGISAASQAVNQLIGLGLVLVSSLVSGLITGFILKLKIFNQVRHQELYADGDFFETPADYDFTTRIISHIDRVEINEYSKLTQKEI